MSYFFVFKFPEQAGQETQNETSWEERSAIANAIYAIEEAERSTFRQIPAS